ncbi:hypothetical protein M422DRAFT_103553, partial [Sphaerobolus stellatus SS14]
LASTGSTLDLGHTNPDHYIGSIEYHGIDPASGFWQVTGAKVSIDYTIGVSGFDTVIDSGTTIMYGPPSAVKTFYSKIARTKLFDPANGFYSFPCSSVHRVAFSWGGGKERDVAADNICIAVYGTSDSFNLGLGTNVWLLGDRYVNLICMIF